MGRQSKKRIDINDVHPLYTVDKNERLKLKPSAELLALASKMWAAHIGESPGKRRTCESAARGHSAHQRRVTTAPRPQEKTQRNLPGNLYYYIILVLLLL